MKRPRQKYKRNEFAFYKDDQAWKWDTDNELSPTDIRELGHSCTSGKVDREVSCQSSSVLCF